MGGAAAEGPRCGAAEGKRKRREEPSPVAEGRAGPTRTHRTPLRLRPPQQPGASTSSSRTSAWRPPAARPRGLPGAAVRPPTALIGWQRPTDYSSRQAPRGVLHHFRLLPARPWRHGEGEASGGEGWGFGGPRLGNGGGGGGGAGRPPSPVWAEPPPAPPASPVPPERGCRAAGRSLPRRQPRAVCGRPPLPARAQAVQAAALRKRRPRAARFSPPPEGSAAGPRLGGRAGKGAALGQGPVAM